MFGGWTEALGCRKISDIGRTTWLQASVHYDVEKWAVSKVLWKSDCSVHTRKRRQESEKKGGP